MALTLEEKILGKNAKERFCPNCEKIKKITDYYKSTSEYFTGTGRMPFCKDCVIREYEKLAERLQDSKKALYRMCGILDLYFDHSLFDTCREQSEKQKANIMQLYIQKTNSLKCYRILSSKDSQNLVNSVVVEASSEEGTATKKKVIDKVTGEIVGRWGEGLNEDDYLDLERNYQTFVGAYGDKSVTQNYLFGELSKLQVEAEKCRRSANITDYLKITTAISKLMSDSNIKPTQEKDLVKEGKDSFSYWTSVIEKEEPITFFEKYKDFDGIEKYINKWFVTPMARALQLVGKEENEGVDLAKVKKKGLDDNE